MQNSTLSLVQPLGTSPALFWPNFSSRKIGMVTPTYSVRALRTEFGFDSDIVTSPSGQPDLEPIVTLALMRGIALGK